MHNLQAAKGVLGDSLVIQEGCIEKARQTLHNLYSWHGFGRAPHETGAEYLTWRNRELNYGAELCCNEVLNNENSFKWTHPRFEDCIKKKFSLFVQSDGGCRKRGHSSTGWSVKAVSSDGTDTTCVARGGTLYSGDFSWTVIEMYVAEKVSSFLTKAFVECC